jgi:hypothetical protein
MIAVSKEQFDRRWDVLPPALREALADNERFNFLARSYTNETGDSTPQRISAVARLSCFVLMGFLRADEVARELEETLQLPRGTAERIARDIDVGLFSEFEDELARLRETAPEAEEKAAAQAEKEKREREEEGLPLGESTPSLFPQVVEETAGREEEGKKAASPAPFPETPLTPTFLETRTPSPAEEALSPEASGIPPLTAEEELAPVMLRTEGEVAPVSLPTDMPMSPESELGLLGAAATPPPKPPSAAKIEFGNVPKQPPEAAKVINYSQFIPPLPQQDASSSAKSSGQEPKSLEGQTPLSKETAAPAPLPTGGTALPRVPQMTRIKVTNGDNPKDVPAGFSSEAPAQPEAASAAPALEAGGEAGELLEKAATIPSKRPGIWAKLKGAFAKNKKQESWGSDGASPLLSSDKMSEGPAAPLSSPEPPPPAPTADDPRAAEKQ